MDVYLCLFIKNLNINAKILILKKKNKSKMHIVIFKKLFKIFLS